MNPKLVVQRIREGSSRRVHLAIRNASCRRYLRRTFTNGDQLVQSYVAETPCDQAVCRDGLVIKHPPARYALARMILEVWFDEIYTRDFYTPESGDTIIDAGANIGLFSLWIARRSAGCRVLAFEPFPENFGILEQNLSAAAAHSVLAIQAGLSGDSGAAAIVDGGRRSQDHRLTPSIGGAAPHPSVRTCSFADVLATAGCDKIALFKCDIEGSERDLFDRVGPEQLTRVTRFAIEYHDNIRPGTLALLQQRLRSTHDLTIETQGTAGYGMLYARLKVT